jgi:hypothetical protein
MARAHRNDLKPIIGRIRPALVEGDLVGQAVQRIGLFKQTPRCSKIAMSTRQEVDRGADAVHGAVQLLPLAADSDAGLVHPPATSCPMPAPMESDEANTPAGTLDQADSQVAQIFSRV